jgi:hypothetical protein
MIKAGFIVRNKFQIRQFDALAGEYPASDYLLYNRKGLEQEFSSEDLVSFQRPVRLIDRRNIAVIASAYDVIFFQTVFPGIELINETPLVSVQYGLAKERHNYGEWRALADLNLMYGKYSADAVSHFGPSVAVGNLKFCGWDYRVTSAQKGEAKRKLGLEPEKPSVLYMPTYGQLGSFEELVGPLAGLSQRYEIMIKGHHNDEKAGPIWMQKASELKHKYLFSGGYDQRMLLEAADVVVSDFSGAVFDAVYARIPVVLYQSRAAERVGTQKFDLSTLEFRERHRIGRVCTDVADLDAAINDVVAEPEFFLEKVGGLRDDLFVDVVATDAVTQATAKVRDLLSGRIPRLSKPQTIVRETIQRLLSVEREMQTLRKARQSFWRRRFADLGALFSALNGA